MSHQLLKGKRGIIFGALDPNSIAWITAERVHEEGGNLCIEPMHPLPCVWALLMNWLKKTGCANHSCRRHFFGRSTKFSRSIG